MQDVNKQAFIISAELSTLSADENRDRTDKLASLLQALRLPFKRAEGMYKGTKENSFYIVAEHTYNNVVRNLANEFEQESYLRIYYDGHAELVYTNGANKGDTTSIGKFTKVTSTTGLQAYTVIAGIIYTCI